MATCAVIIVTHNSERFLGECLRCLREQTLLPQQIVLVDCGSATTDYLASYRHSGDIELVFTDNIGFCGGNNLGIARVDKSISYLLFLNPDLFLTPTYLQEALAFMEQSDNAHCGAMTGALLGYDIARQCPTGLYDSTGIFQRWWGQWYDRGQGHSCQPLRYHHVEEVHAICGASFLARRIALQQVALSDNAIFDPTFFMYKEDIDLSCRLRQQGWQLLFVPQLLAYHCRGWQQQRHRNNRAMRLLSARNELSLQRRYGSGLAQLYSLAKYGAVRFLNI